MLAIDVIEPTQTKWASLIMLWPKEGGPLCFCFDYQNLNAVTIQVLYSIPSVDECIKLLGDATIFSTLDATTEYGQAEIANKDCDKMAFTSHHRFLRFTRMPFGLKNTPSTFQSAMDVVRTKVK